MKLTKKDINTIGNALIIKANCKNIEIQDFVESGKADTETRKLVRFDHELNGMLSLLKDLGVDFDIVWANKYGIREIVVAGEHFPCTEMFYED